MWYISRSCAVTVSIALALAVLTDASDHGLEEETALCTSLRYCDRGTMHQALRSLGLFFKERSEVIAQANQMGRRRCSCHASCNYFGTCCPDANTQRKTAQVDAQSSSRCLGLFGGAGTRIIDKCPSASNVTLQKLCHGTDRLDDKARAYPMRVPGDVEPYVTSARTELTYKNGYCGECAGENATELVTWTLSQDPMCDDKKLQRCRYYQTPPKGGVAYSDHFLSPRFYREELYTFGEIGDKTVCDVNIIRSCPPDSDADLARRCKRVRTAIVQDLISHELYANIYCAQCNNITIQTSCESMNIVYEGAVSSTSTTTEPESVSESESEPTSSTSSTSTTSMATTTVTEIIEDVTGTSTSSTSSTSTTSTTTSPLDAVGSDLNAGESFPSGSVIGTNNDPRGQVIGQNTNEIGVSNQVEGFPSGVQISIEDNPRGEVVENHNNVTEEQQVVTLQGDGEPFPHGTVLTPDESNPRGLVSSLDSERNHTGTAVSPEDTASDVSSTPVPVVTPEESPSHNHFASQPPSASGEAEESQGQTTNKAAAELAARLRAKLGM